MRYSLVLYDWIQTVQLRPKHGHSMLSTNMYCYVSYCRSVQCFTFNEWGLTYGYLISSPSYPLSALLEPSRSKPVTQQNSIGMPRSSLDSLGSTSTHHRPIAPISILSSMVHSLSHHSDFPLSPSCIQSSDPSSLYYPCPYLL